MDLTFSFCATRQFFTPGRFWGDAAEGLLDLLFDRASDFRPSLGVILESIVFSVAGKIFVILKIFSVMADESAFA